MHNFYLQKQHIHRTSPELDKSINTSIFKDENYFVYVFKKSDRLVSAVYMVSNFFSESEPAKTTLRSLGLFLLKETMELPALDAFLKGEKVKSISRTLLEMNSLLETFCLAGMVSEMNFAILHAE